MTSWIILSFGIAAFGLFLVLIVIPIFCEKMFKDSFHMYLVEIFILAFTALVSMCTCICGNDYHCRQIIERGRSHCQYKITTQSGNKFEKEIEVNK